MKEIARLGDGYRNDLSDFVFSPDGKYLVASSTNVIWLSDLQTGAIKTLQKGVSGYQHDLPVPDSWRQFTAAACDQTHIGAPRNPNNAVMSLPRHSDKISNTTFSPDGTLLAVSMTNRLDIGHVGQVGVWDIKSGELRIVLTCDSQPKGIAFTVDGKSLQSVDVQGHVHSWDIATGQDSCGWLFDFYMNPGWYVFSPDGRWLAAGDRGDRGEDGSAKVWEVARGRVVYVADIYRPMTMFAFTPDSAVLVEVNRDKPVIFRDMDTLQPGVSLGDSSLRMERGALNADATRFSAPTQDGVRLWDTRSGALIAIFRDLTSSVAVIAFGQNLLAAGEYSGKISLWDTTNQQLLATTTGSKSVIMGKGLMFNPDERLLISASESGIVQLFETT